MQLRNSNVLISSILIAAVCYLCLPGAQSATGSMLTKADCRDRTVVDFEHVLDAMRPRAHPPSPGRLPFGPAGLRLGYLGSRLVAGGGIIGFTLRNEGRDLVHRAGWSARSTLTVVRKSGAPIAVIREKQQSLDPVMSGSLENQRLGAFSVSGRSAFYRVDLAVKHESVVKHRYREYFRVVPRRVDLRLGLTSSTPRPGGELTWRLENFGTVPFSYGLSYRIERYEDGKWIIDPITPMGFPGIGFSDVAGAAGHCQSITLPPEMALGRYRVSKTASSGSARERSVMAEFWVES